MLRTALKPRWLALLAVVLVAAAAMARLGEWQLDRARQQGERDRISAAAARPPVPLASLLGARTAFPVDAADRRVTARGQWDTAHQVLVPGRRLGDATGLWVLTPFRLPDGSAVAVVRGWVPDAGSAASPGSGPAPGDADLAGVLRPSEPVDDLRPGAVAGAPPGQVPLVAAALFAQDWPYPLVDGYVVQTSPAPAAGLRAVPAQRESGGLALQNLSYALQWWLFSAFGLFFWWRLVRDDSRGRLRPLPAAAGGLPVRHDEDDEAVRTAADAGDRQ